jgi:hypothetical protein
VALAGGAQDVNKKTAKDLGTCMSVGCKGLKLAKWKKVVRAQLHVSHNFALDEARGQELFRFEKRSAAQHLHYL